MPVHSLESVVVSLGPLGIPVPRGRLTARVYAIAHAHSTFVSPGTVEHMRQSKPSRPSVFHTGSHKVIQSTAERLGMTPERSKLE